MGPGARPGRRGVCCIKHSFAISPHDLREVCWKSPCPPRKQEGAGNAGCALHPRSRVQTARGKRTRAYRFSGGNPTFPAQWLYGLWRALPGDEFVFVTVIDEYGLSKPGWARKTSADLTPATGAGTTRFCRTQQPVFTHRLRPKSDFGESRGSTGLWRRSSARCSIAHRPKPTLRSPARRRCRVHRIPSQRS